MNTQDKEALNTLIYNARVALDDLVEGLEEHENNPTMPIDVSSVVEDVREAEKLIDINLYTGN